MSWWHWCNSCSHHWLELETTLLKVSWINHPLKLEDLIPVAILYGLRMHDVKDMLHQSHELCMLCVVHSLTWNHDPVLWYISHNTVDVLCQRFLYLLLELCAEYKLLQIFQIIRKLRFNQTVVLKDSDSIFFINDRNDVVDVNNSGESINVINDSIFESVY